MSKVPGGLPYTKIVNALRRDGWIVIKHKGSSHIQLCKRIGDQTMRLTIPAHKAVKRGTLAPLLKQAQIDVERFLELL